MAEAGAATARRGPRALRLLSRLLAGAAALLALLLLLAAFAPVPSTLMLWRWATGQSVERVWTPLAAISPQLPLAVISSEDQRFCAHHGVDFGALREVLSEEGGPSRGASTITMQVVRNLWLWQGGGITSYLRKGLELPLALAADAVLPKRRIMELYLNVAEFGDGAFGAEAAARRYFRTGAGSLDARQAARLAASLPNPALRNPFRPSARAAANARRIQSRAEKGGGLADCLG